MAGLFGGSTPKMPTPKVVRMPTTTDPNAEKAAARYRNAAMLRKGRRSTILSDSLQEMTGSSGQSLGA